MNKDYKATLKIQEFPVKRGWYIKGLDKKEFPVKFQKAVLKKLNNIYDETELCIYYKGGGSFYLATKNHNGYSDNWVDILRVSEDVIRLENDWGQVIDYNLKDDKFYYISGERNIHEIYSYYQL